MGTLKRRILAGLGANAFGQVLTIVTQLATLPLFLSHWDITRYGIWLMISSVPSYFSMADGGIVNAARNEMTIALGSRDVLHANRVFQSALIFILSMSLAIILVVVAVLFFTPIVKNFEQDYAITLLILVIGIFVSFVNGLSEATFCSVGKYGFGTVMGQTIRLAEWAGGIFGLMFFGSFISVALGMLLMRVAGVVLSILLSKKYAPEFIWGFRLAELVQFKKTMQPALYFLVFPLANALSIQGFTLLIGSMLGPATVTVFNTYRTLARVIVQATSILSFSVGPELSRLYGARQYPQYHSLFRCSQIVSVGLVVLTSAVVALIGPWILQFWTHGRVQYQSGLLWTMLLYATVVGFGHVPKVLLMSINRHSSIALASIAVYAMSLLCAYLVGGMLNLIGNIFVMTAGELCLVLLTFYFAEFEIRRPDLAGNC